LGFFLPVFENQHPGKWMLGLGMMAYDLMALKNQHRFYGPEDVLKSEPHLCAEGLLGGFHFFDAQVDDSPAGLKAHPRRRCQWWDRRQLCESEKYQPGPARNVVGVDAEDAETGDARTFFAPVVINATGPWTDQLHPLHGTDYHVRLLRGSHLVFSSKTLPVSHAISLLHPEDGRFVFTIPWEGVVLFGTTDLEHEKAKLDSPKITDKEVSYLLKGVQAFFPSLKIARKDCISTFAGVRTVFSKSIKDPSAESREHFLRTDKGLISVAGGKLTTFRKIAWDVLELSRPYLSFIPPVDTQKALVFQFVNAISKMGVFRKKPCVAYWEDMEKVLKRLSRRRCRKIWIIYPTHLHFGRSLPMWPGMNRFVISRIFSFDGCVSESFYPEEEKFTCNESAAFVNRLSAGMMPGGKGEINYMQIIQENYAPPQKGCFKIR
jgi:glycerol-3-phosphate dehydrogenase